jgi:hypothetical protein
MDHLRIRCPGARRGHVLTRAALDRADVLHESLEPVLRCLAHWAGSGRVLAGAEVAAYPAAPYRQGETRAALDPGRSGRCA